VFVFRAAEPLDAERVERPGQPRPAGKGARVDPAGSSEPVPLGGETVEPVGVMRGEHAPGERPRLAGQP